MSYSEFDSGADLRMLMSGFPTGVCVITVIDADGRPRGMTCTSMCSVSLVPPTLLACIRDASPTLQAILQRGAFSLNLLQSGMRSVAELFASGAPDRFSRVAWQFRDGSGGPHLTAAAHMTADCAMRRAQRVGDHVVVFADVVRVTRRSSPRPLLYGMRQYADWPAIGGTLEACDEQ